MTTISGVVFRGPVGFLSLAVLLMSCDAALHGEPAKHLSKERKLLADVVLDATLDDKYITDALALPKGEARVTARNRIILARMAEIDTLYSQFETGLLAESRQSGFALTLAGATAGLLGASVKGARAKALGLLGTGINTVQTTYQKEVLAERTMNAYIGQMRANRALVKQEILGRLQAKKGFYPLEAALGDLERYRQAGTLTAAIVGITEIVAEAEKAASGAAARSEREFFTTGVVVRRGADQDDEAQSEANQKIRVALSGKVGALEIGRDKLAALINQRGNFLGDTVKGDLNEAASLLGLTGDAQATASTFENPDRDAIELIQKAIILSGNIKNHNLVVKILGEGS